MSKNIFLAVLMSGVLSAGMSWAANGTAIIQGTAPGSAVKGYVRLEDSAKGVRLMVQLQGLPPGQHGFHIHEFGSCADAGKAAGAHYNPLTQPHGQVLKDGVQHAHAGDLGNVTADTKGAASLDVVIPGVTLTGGPYAVAGRSFVVHEKADDFSQPAGNAGGRIGCGVIVISDAAIPK